MTDLKSGFDGATLKIERAYYHIEEVKSLLEAVREIEQQGITLQNDGPCGFHLDFLPSSRPFKDLPLAIGDAIHNLRAALDHVWMALWRKSGKTGFGTFPFHETRKNIEDAIAKSPVKEAFPEVEKIVLDYVKPYRDEDGNSILWAITKLDKIDKHNLIIPLVEKKTIQNLKVFAPGGGDIRVRTH